MAAQTSMATNKSTVTNWHRSVPQAYVMVRFLHCIVIRQTAMPEFATTIACDQRPAQSLLATKYYSILDASLVHSRDYLS
jgi:hypothetical protein